MKIRRQQRPSRFGIRHFAFVLLQLAAFSNSFQTPISLSRTSPSSESSLSPLISTRPSSSSSSSSVVLFDSTRQESESLENEIWVPKLRQIMGGIASLGALETGYLTYNKLFQQLDSLPFCDVDGHGCNDILNGPYSYVPFTNIPLSAMGFLAYCSVAGLALIPLLSSSSSSSKVINENQGDDDTSNRVALIALTTTMGTFSIFLMALLFGVLQTNCPYCVFSAVCSISLAMLAWIGGCLPDGNKSGIRLATTGFLTSTVTAVLLFVSSAISNIDSVDTSGGVSWGGGTLLASTTAAGGSTNNSQTKQLLSPPAITTDSSKEAIDLASTLQGMNAKMYGAYWCSHCYDQKEVFGKQAFSKIEYVECSKDGVNSKTKLCKAMDVPGYPTWEIQGKLYPGQQELDELQDLVKSITKGI